MSKAPSTTTNPTEAWQQDRRHCLHPFHHFASFDEDGSLVINRGEGCYIVDEAGNEYFDAVGDKETRAIFPPEVNIGKRISNRAEELGPIVRPIVDLNILSLPLTTTKNGVDFVVATLRRAIELTINELLSEALWTNQDA